MIIDLLQEAEKKKRNKYSNTEDWKTLAECLTIKILKKLKSGSKDQGPIGKLFTGNFKNMKNDDFDAALNKMTSDADIIKYYRKAFDDVNLSDDFYKSHGLFEIMEIFAGRAAYNEADEDDKISNESEYIDEDGKYKDDVLRTDSVVKPYYTKYIDKIHQSFEAGVNSVKEQIESGTVKDPMTGEKIDAKTGLLSKDTLKKIGSGVAGWLGNAATDILGLNNKDILSSAIRGVFGLVFGKDGIKGLFKKDQRYQFNKNKKLKIKPVSDKVESFANDMQKMKAGVDYPE